MLSRLGQVNHYYVDAYYADRLCGFPQSLFAPGTDTNLPPPDTCPQRLAFRLKDCALGVAERNVIAKFPRAD